MQVGEQNLALAQEVPLRRQRLFHLHDHLGAGENFGGRIDEFGPGAGILLVRRSRADAGAFLHDRAMAVMDELGDCGGRHGDAEFVVFDFLGNADEHGTASLTPRVQSWRNPDAP